MTGRRCLLRRAQKQGEAIQSTQAKAVLALSQTDQANCCGLPHGIPQTLHGTHRPTIERPGAVRWLSVQKYLHCEPDGLSWIPCSHGGRRQSAPKSFPLTSANAPWRMCAHATARLKYILGEEGNKTNQTPKEQLTPARQPSVFFLPMPLIFCYRCRGHLEHGFHFLEPEVCQLSIHSPKDTSVYRFLKGQCF